MNQAQRNKLIIILGAIAAIGPLSIDMYLPGFSAIAKDLHTDISQVSLSLTTYFIGISVGQLVYGPLLDRYGRKLPLLFGFALYLLAALGCAMAPNITSFIGLRLLLALGGCVGMVASRAIIRDRYDSDEIARAFSALILVMGVAPIIAPTLGGHIVAAYGWRYIFWFLSAYAAILLLVIFFLLRESHGNHPEVSLRPKQVARNYWSVLRNKDFLVYGLAATTGLAGMFSYISGASFVVMELLHFSEEAFGWLFGINAMGFISCSQINRYLLKKRNSESVSMSVSYFTLLAAVSLIISVSMGIPNMYIFLGALFMFISSLGFINPNLQGLALSPFKKNAGVASALIGSLRMLGGAVASSLVGIFHNDTAWPMVILMSICALTVFSILLGRRLHASKLVMEN